jgi:hypothetical protein
MELTARQKQTLEDLEGAEDGSSVRFVVTGCDPRTGTLHLRAQQSMVLTPDGQTSDA